MFTQWLFILSLFSQEPARPLPEAQTFRSVLPGMVDILSHALVRTTIASDFLPEAKDYTYVERETIIALAANGRADKTDTNVYEMDRGPEIWQYYRKQVLKSGRPLTPEENTAQARRHQTWEDSMRTSLKASVTALNAQEQGSTPDPGLRELFDLRVTGRDRIDGIPIVLLEVKANPNYKPKSDQTRRWQHLAMRVWVTEDTREVVRLEAGLGDPFDMGFGLVEKGANVGIERRPMADGKVWLPVRIEVSSRQSRPDGKTLSPRQHVISEFSNFKKFTVDVLIEPTGSTRP